MCFSRRPQVHQVQMSVRRIAQRRRQSVCIVHRKSDWRMKKRRHSLSRLPLQSPCRRTPRRIVLRNSLHMTTRIGKVHPDHRGHPGPDHIRGSLNRSVQPNVERQVTMPGDERRKRIQEDR